MSDKIVKYHNDVNNIRTGSLTERELDIFVSLIFTMQEKDSREVIMTFAELKALSEASVRHNDRLIKSIKSMSRKLINLNQEVILPNGDIRIFNLFEILDIKISESRLVIKITETFKYMLNDLLNNFTYFTLKEFVELKSSYSKQVYKILKQYENKKNKESWKIIKLETFKDLLGVPISATTSYLNRDVLAPVLKELSPIFTGLKLEKLTKDGKLVGRGRKTHSLKFTWDNIKHTRNTLEENIKAKQDKEKIEADEKAKRLVEKNHEKLENSIGNKHNENDNLTEFKKEVIKLTNTVSIKSAILIASNFEEVNKIIEENKLNK